MKISLMADFQSTVLCRSVTKLCGSQVKLKRSGMEEKMGEVQKRKALSWRLRLLRIILLGAAILLSVSSWGGV